MDPSGLIISAMARLGLVWDVVEITPEHGEPLLAQGTMVQRPLLPKWLLPAVCITSSM